MQISLTRNKYALVDDEDYTFLNQWVWEYFINKRTKQEYAIRRLYLNGKRVTIWMHREIMKTPEDLVTDHKDGLGLNNQKDNLRNCTQHQNRMNNKLQTNNTSGFTGVSWCAYHKKWVGGIKFKGKKIRTTYYSSKEDAAIARDDLAKQYFGKFARLNYA